MRQGYSEPLPISDNYPKLKWSSFNLFSCDASTPFGKQTGTVNATLAQSPLSLGAFFKKGNYAQGISVGAIEQAGPLAPTNGVYFKMSNGSTQTLWNNIYGVARLSGDAATTITTINKTNYDTETWHWAKFNAGLKISDTETRTRTYRMPTIGEWETLLDGDFGIGVLYADGATEPSNETRTAFGFLDPTNTLTRSATGMRGFICYNTRTANQIFFPIGTNGLGRRTMQEIPNNNYRGTLRYSSVDYYLNSINNCLRPIPYNMPNAPGAIYWAYKEVGGKPGWDMNYFDLNFNAYDYAMSYGPYGDAVPIRLVLDE